MNIPWASTGLKPDIQRYCAGFSARHPQLIHALSTGRAVADLALVSQFTADSRRCRFGSARSGDGTAS